MGPSGTPARGGSELPSGDDDTPLGGADFYELATNGVPLVDWVTALIAGAPTHDV